MQPHEGGPRRSESTPVALARLVAWTLPLAVALWRSSTLPHWRSDLGLLRDVALSGLGVGGGVSTALVQLASLVPLGSLVFRASLVSVFALAAIALALFELAHRALGELEGLGEPQRSRWLAPGLSMLAALAATMTPALQGEATVAGSTLVGVALALWAVASVERALGDARAHRRLFAVAGAALGLSLAELPAAGLAGCAAIGASWLARRTMPADRAGGAPIPRRMIGAAAGALGLGLVLGAAPPVLRSFAAGRPLDLGAPWLGAALVEPSAEPQLGLVTSLVGELGLVPALLAAAGLAVLLVHPRSRALGATLASFAVLDVVLLRSASPELGLGALRMLALGAAGIAHVAGAFYAVSRLIAMRVPLAKAAAALLVAFDATVIALVVEQAGESADRSSQLGAFEWTRAALVDLDPSAALEVDRPTTTWRLLTAQLVEGRRPDVLVIPLRLVRRGRIASDLLVSERHVEPLLRSLALTGRADEYAQSELARARLLHAELDRGWDARALTHATLDGPWLSIETQAFGKADRKPSVDSTLERMRPLLACATAPESDERTRQVVGATMRAHAKTLLRLGDAPSAIRYLAELDAPGTSALVSGASLDVRFAAAAAKLSALRKPPQKPSSAARSASQASPPRKR